MLVGYHTRPSRWRTGAAGAHDELRLRQATADAIGRRAQIPPLTISGPFDVEVDLHNPLTADLATLVPGISRAAGGRTVAFTTADFADAYRLLLLLGQLVTIKPG
nr:M55 family metallopeptidase [Spongiactinospora gelatinilytica]